MCINFNPISDRHIGLLLSHTQLRILSSNLSFISTRQFIMRLSDATSIHFYLFMETVSLWIHFHCDNEIQ